MQPNQVLDTKGNSVGSYQSAIETPDGAMILITRDMRLGGGTIVVSTHEAGKPDGVWRLPYGELSIREAPPYSQNVDLHAYFEFWRRLADSNVNFTGSDYVATGSGPVSSGVEVPDSQLLKAVNLAVREVPGGLVDYHLIETSVSHGTVLLEGYQNDVQGRFAAAEAAASVPGVKEIVNMLVIRAI